MEDFRSLSFENVPWARRFALREPRRPLDVDHDDPDSLRSRTVLLVLMAQARWDLVHIAAQNGIPAEDGPDLADLVLSDIGGTCGFEHHPQRAGGHLGEFTILGATLALTAAKAENERGLPCFKITSARQPEASEQKHRRRQAYDPSLGVGDRLEFQVFHRLPFSDERRFLELLTTEATNHQAVMRERD